jgi:secondary thiamine-phosphate synthase enzyme
MELGINSKKKDEIIDITERINDLIREEGTTSGICTIFVRHTTCALTCADLDPGTDIDFISFIREITPELQYKHPHDPNHAPDHIISSIIGPSVSIPVEDGKLLLGTWQRVVLVELNGPRERRINVVILETE